MKRSGYGFIEWVLLFVLALIWGSSFILMKRGLEVFSPVQVASIRMSAAFLCLFPFIISKFREIPAAKWKFILGSGILGNAIPALLFTYAQTKIQSSVAGILNSLVPLFSLLVAFFIFKTRFSIIQIIGILLGLTGAVGMMIFRAGGTIDVNYKYGLLVVLATICYAFSVNIINFRLNELKPVLISGFAMTMVGPPFMIYLFTTDFITVASSGNHALRSLLCIIILGMFGTAISIVLFNRLIKTTSVLFATSVTYLIPVVALIWGLSDSESLGFVHVIGLSAILGGVYLVNRH